MQKRHPYQYGLCVDVLSYGLLSVSDKKKMIWLAILCYSVDIVQHPEKTIAG
jgi:hypothetical protein